MEKKYRVSLIDREIQTSNDILKRGKHSAELYKRARALLQLGQGDTDAEVAAVADMSIRGVQEIRKRFVEEGFESVLHGKPRGHRPCVLNDEDKARVVQLACEKTEDGTRRWTLRAISKKMLALRGKNVSHETIRQTLKKMKLSRG